MTDPQPIMDTVGGISPGLASLCNTDAMLRCPKSKTNNDMIICSLENTINKVEIVESHATAMDTEWQGPLGKNDASIAGGSGTIAMKSVQV